MTDLAASTRPADAQRRAPGLTIAQKLILTFLVFILILGGVLALVYQKYVPALVTDQIELRVESVARAFASASFNPLVERDYLLVNKIAEDTAKLPDVAYAAAVNAKDIAVAGIFGDLGSFDPNFAALVKQKGFPQEILRGTQLPKAQNSAKTTLKVGGQEIMDYALRLPQTESVIHVGLFTAQVQAAQRATLMPLLIMLGVMAVAGILMLLLVARTVSRPIRQLSEQAERISMGELSDEIDIKAGGEIWQLAESFKRMQTSIRYAVTQLRRHQQNQ